MTTSPLGRASLRDCNTQHPHFCSHNKTFDRALYRVVVFAVSRCAFCYHLLFIVQFWATLVTRDIWPSAHFFNVAPIPAPVRTPFQSFRSAPHLPSQRQRRSLRSHHHATLNSSNIDRLPSSIHHCLSVSITRRSIPSTDWYAALPPPVSVSPFSTFWLLSLFSINHARLHLAECTHADLLLLSRSPSLNGFTTASAVLHTPWVRRHPPSNKNWDGHWAALRGDRAYA